MAVRFEVTIPLLRIFDVPKAREFYVGFLGFSVDWEHRFDEAAPVYMQVSRGGLTLHLTQHHGDCCPGSAVSVSMTGLDEFHREITAKGYAHMRPGIEEALGGGRCVDVTDPFGNRLSFNEWTVPDAPGGSSAFPDAPTETP